MPENLTSIERNETETRRKLGNSAAILIDSKIARIRNENGKKYARLRSILHKSPAGLLPYMT